MDMQITSITSDTVLDNIEKHFRVYAGPGAGKTHWLCGHIKNVLHHSKRLEKTRKIACITYTNTAVETILSRIGTSAERAEISTIHSFLYKHVVKPYASAIAVDYGLNTAEMDGHDDRVITNYGFIEDWKTRTKQKRIHDNDKIMKAFYDIIWKFDSSGELKAQTKYPHKVGGYSLKSDSFMEYKRMAWEKGVVHHDDVLFFSYQIIIKKPFVLEVLRSKFPYIFIDEFQDSSPIQIKILKEISASESIVGIIGDHAQSIYKFQGADPDQFMSFTLPGMADYVMEENRRSTNEIIDVLNLIRKDITQQKYRNETGPRPHILCGDLTLSSQKAKALCGNSALYSLSRDNITANLMKKQLGGIHDAKLFEKLDSIDKPGSGNKYRSKIVAICIKSIEYAKEGKFKDAVNEMLKEFKSKSDPLAGRKKSLDFIVVLLSHYETFKDGTLLDFFTFVKQHIKPEITALKTGAPKTFYESHSYKQIALCVKIPEDKSCDKTMHKAKGDEFENVLVVLDEEKDIEFLVKPDIKNDEEHRVRYVAASRARDRLFITVPALTSASEKILSSYFFIERI